jgi:DnaJ-class molecular chaperone
MADLNESGINNPSQSNAQNEEEVNNPASGQGHARGTNLNTSEAKMNLDWARDAHGENTCEECGGTGRWRGQFCAACHGSGTRRHIP